MFHPLTNNFRFVTLHEWPPLCLKSAFKGVLCLLFKNCLGGYLLFIVDHSATFLQASVYENPPGNLMTMWHNWESLSSSEYFAFNNPLQGLISVLERIHFWGNFMLQIWWDLRIKTLQNPPPAALCLFVRTHITAHAATSGWSIFCSVCTALCACISKDLLMVYLWRSSL